jgi:2'-5' RNA ligase
MSIELAQLYDNLFDRSIGQINRGEIEIDRQIDNDKDRRRGLTLLIRPHDEIKARVREFQEQMLDIDGQQYYQPVSDLHVTALSIISCYEGFDLNQVRVFDYEQIIFQSLEKISEFRLQFKGITASRGAVMVQGFPVGEGLNILRNSLRNNFKVTNLQQSIDSRYKQATAHMTSVRFRKELCSPNKFVNLLREHRTTEFGEMNVKSLELVYNDWYQTSNIAKTLHSFHL